MSYQLDSRNENVELNYNNLRISSPLEITLPTTLQAGVTFNDPIIVNDSAVFNGTVSFAGDVLGYTWPRSMRSTWTAVAYGIAPAHLDPFVSAGQIIDLDTFNSETPSQGPYTDFFTLNPLTGHLDIVATGYYSIQITFVKLNNLAANSMMSASLVWRVTPVAIVQRLDSCECVDLSVSGVTPARYMSLSTTSYFETGNQLFTSFGCGDNDSITAIWRITKLK